MAVQQGKPGDAAALFPFLSLSVCFAQAGDPAGIPSLGSSLRAAIAQGSSQSRVQAQRSLP